MKTRYVILLSVLLLLVGFVGGSVIMSRMWQKETAGMQYALRVTSKSNKIATLVSAIDQLYVDSVDVDTLVDAALPVILSKLDPHSLYYPAEEVKESNEELHGSFSGIGVQFSMTEDTIHVNSVIKGGPAEKVGVMAGDKILYIDDSLCAGKKIPNTDIVKRLKGPEGTEVKIGVERSGADGIIDFTIKRGPIPVRSVNVFYMISENTGYIALDKFGETTYAEMMNGLAELKSKGCEKLVIDLRGNTGGYLVSAIQIANEFLPKGQMIVYTQGVHSDYAAEHANGLGHFQNIPLVVMIDESTASAAEIVTGAIQDNDRGTIVGRRSFGKGLVQQPIDFSDGSSVRLTIARYYTPAGRCIQKPYGTSEEDYAMDIVKRWERGEFFSADSVHFNEDEVFTTKSGRKVYGGGGIMPDIFVPQDTIQFNQFYVSVVTKSLIPKFSLKYVDRFRQKLIALDDCDDVVRYLNGNGVMDEFYSFVSENGVVRPGFVPDEISELITRNVIAGILYDAFGDEMYSRYVNSFDPTVKKAVELLN